MFCKQNAYPPKSLEPKSVLQRIHTKPGTAMRKLISKQDFLQPYFDCEFSDVHSSRIAQNIERYIKIAKKYQRETKIFVEAVLNKIYLLHKYNLKVAEVTFRYPLTPNFTQLLSRYLVLECSVLYKGEHHTRRYAATVEERILKLLQNVYNAYLESLNSVPPEKLLKERCKAILNLFIRVKSEFEVQNDLMENIAEKLLIKMGRLEQVNALKGRCIPCPSDTFLRDPTVVNTCRNIITSDYGTDDNLKIEEEVNQVDVQNEDNYFNRESDVRRDISEILRSTHEDTTHGRVEKTLSPYIEGEQGLALLEDEIKSSPKRTRRKAAIEERRVESRERQCEMFLTHKPFHDVKPYVKDEVIDLISDEDCGTSENAVEKNESGEPSVVDEIIVLDDDGTNSDAMQSSVECKTEQNEEDILELDSDDDDSFKLIPKEEEEELLRDETDEVNRQSRPVGPTNKAISEIEENTSNINAVEAKQLNNTAFEKENNQEKTNLDIGNETSVCNVYPIVIENRKQLSSYNEKHASNDLQRIEEKEVSEKIQNTEDSDNDIEDISSSHQLQNIPVQESEELNVIEPAVRDSEVEDCIEPVNSSMAIPGDSLIEDNHVTLNDEDNKSPQRKEDNVTEVVTLGGSKIKEDLLENRDAGTKLIEGQALEVTEEVEEISRSLECKNLLERDEEKLDRYQEITLQTENEDIEKNNIEINETDSTDDTKTVDEAETDKEDTNDQVKVEEIVEEIAEIQDEKETLTLPQEQEEEAVKSNEDQISTERTIKEIAEDQDEKETITLPLEVGELPKEETADSNEEQINTEGTVEKVAEGLNEKETFTLSHEVEELSKEDTVDSNGELINTEKIVKKIAEGQDEKETLTLSHEVGLSKEKTADSNEEQINAEETVEKIAENQDEKETLTLTDDMEELSKEETVDSNGEKIVEKVAESQYEKHTLTLSHEIEDLSNKKTVESNGEQIDTEKIVEKIAEGQDEKETLTLSHGVEELPNEEQLNTEETVEKVAEGQDEKEALRLSHEIEGLSNKETVDSNGEQINTEKIVEKINESQDEKETLSLSHEIEGLPNEDKVHSNGEEINIEKIVEKVAEDQDENETLTLFDEVEVLSKEETVNSNGEQINTEEIVETVTEGQDEKETLTLSPEIEGLSKKETADSNEEQINTEKTGESQDEKETLSLSHENEGLSNEETDDSNLQINAENTIEKIAEGQDEEESLTLSHEIERELNEETADSNGQEINIEKIVEKIEELLKEETVDSKEQQINIGKMVDGIAESQVDSNESLQEDNTESIDTTNNLTPSDDAVGDENIVTNEKILNLHKKENDTIRKEIRVDVKTNPDEMSIDNTETQLQATEKEGMGDKNETDKRIKDLQDNGDNFDVCNSEEVTNVIDLSVSKEKPGTIQVLEESLEESTKGETTDETEIGIATKDFKNNTSEVEQCEGNKISDDPKGIFMPDLLETSNMEEKQYPVEQIIEEPPETCLNEKIIIQETATNAGQTNEETTETEEVFQFCSTEQEIELTTEDVEHFELVEHVEVDKNNTTVTEKQQTNEKIADVEENVDIHITESSEFEVYPENIYQVSHFETEKSTESNIEEICYPESDLIDNLHIQKEEIVTEVDTLELGVSEEIIISENGSEDSTDRTTADNEEHPVTNEIIPLEKNEILEICTIPEENTSLDILATVATEVSRHDSLIRKETKKTKKTHNERRKKQLNLKNKTESAQKRQNTSKTKPKEVLDISADLENKRVTRSSQKENRTEFYHGSKCKPHDFVITNNSGAPPPSNNIYTQKLSEIPLTSEDSNDSEGNLQIDEDEEPKTLIYDENTMEENLVFFYEPKVKGMVLISIPDTCQGNFDFLTQIEQLDDYPQRAFAKEQPDRQYIGNSTRNFGDFGGRRTFENETDPSSNLKKKNHKPFRTKAEQKDYDKFSMKPYVSIERLNVVSESERNGNKNEDDVLKDRQEVEIVKLFKKPKPKQDGINRLPKRDERKHAKEVEDSDDDIPLLQRTQPDCKQAKKSLINLKSAVESKKQKVSRKIKAEKLKTKSKKSHGDTKENKKEKMADSLSSITSFASPVSTFKKEVCFTNLENGTTKNDDKKSTPLNLEEGKSQNSSYEEDIKSSNTKYYTTPKLRRKSVSRHNLNRSEKNSIKSDETKQVIFNSDKKYYTPPKLRRKSMAEAEIRVENSADTKRIAPKPIKLATLKVDILSKCKNTISPTTEKLKKKLEIDFKLNTQENPDNSLQTSPEIGKDSQTEEQLPKNDFVCDANASEDIAVKEPEIECSKQSLGTLPDTKESEVEQLPTDTSSVTQPAEVDLTQPEICKTKTICNISEVLSDLEKAIVESDAVIKNVDNVSSPASKSNKDTLIGIDSLPKRPTETELDGQEVKKETKLHPQSIASAVVPNIETETREHNVMNKDTNNIEIGPKDEALPQSKIKPTKKTRKNALNGIKTLKKGSSITKYNRKINKLTKLNRRNERHKDNKQSNKLLKKQYKIKTAQSKKKLRKAKAISSGTELYEMGDKSETSKRELMELTKPEKVPELPIDGLKNQELTEPDSVGGTDMEQILIENPKGVESPLIEQEIEKDTQTDTKPVPLKVFSTSEECISNEDNTKVELNTTLENVVNLELRNNQLTDLPSEELEENREDEKVFWDSALPENRNEDPHDLSEEGTESALNHADNALIEPKVDIFESSDTTPFVKTTNNSDPYTERNQDEEAIEEEINEKDNNITSNGKNEPSQNMEKAKLKGAIDEDKADNREDIDMIENSNDNLMEVPATVASEEVIHSKDFSTGNTEESNTELNLNEHDGKIVIETLEFLLQKVTENIETPNENKNTSSINVEVDSKDHSTCNEEILTRNEELGTELHLDEPFEIPIETKPEISELAPSSNQESDNTQLDVFPDIPLENKNLSKNNECNGVLGDSIDLQPENDSIIIPLEKSPDTENSWMDKIKENSDLESNNADKASESKNNNMTSSVNEKNDEILYELPEKLEEQPLDEEKNSDNDTTPEENFNIDPSVNNQFVNSNKDENLQPEAKKPRKIINEDESTVSNRVEEIIEPQENDFETMQSSHQPTKEIAEKNNSSPLTETRKVEESAEITETTIKEPLQSGELIGEDKMENKEQLTDIIDDSIEITTPSLPDPKPSKAEDAISECIPTEMKNKELTDYVNNKLDLPTNKRKRRNNPPIKEISAEKKSKLLEIKIDVSPTATHDNCTSPRTHSPLSASPKKKEKRSIECIINQLKEEKESCIETNDETVKSPVVIVDVGTLKKKLLQKIKGHNLSKDFQNAEIVGGKTKAGQSEIGNTDLKTDRLRDNLPTDVNSTTNTSCVTTTVQMICDTAAEEEIKSVSSAENVQETQTSGIESTSDLLKEQKAPENIDNPILVEPVTSSLTSSVEDVDITETSTPILKEPEVREVYSSFEEGKTVKTDDSENSYVTSISELREPIDFSSGAEISNVFNNNVENKGSVEETANKMLNIVEENPKTEELPATINSERIPELPPINEIISECIPLTMVEEQTKYDESPVAVPEQDTPRNLEVSLDQTKKPFSSDCLEMSPKKSIADSVSTCVEGFDSTNVETNLLNLCDLMLQVDTVGNVAQPSEAVCMLSNIISTSISSTTNKLPCMSTAPINFTFPVTSQTDMKDRFVPMNDIDTKKSIFGDSSTAAEKLPPTKNGNCLFSLNEQMGESNSGGLGSSSISLNLQEVDFSKTPFDSMQAFDLISSNSVIQSSAGNDFINEVTVGNEESDVTEARNSNAIDHNYTMEPLGGPLLSEGPEEEHIFSSAFNKNLVDSIRFPLNDNQLPSELSESDDTYKLNLDNEYAVKNLVMLGGQTSDVNSFPLSNYNLSDIKRMNLIEDNISNSEDNSNSLDTASLVISMEQESRDVPNNTWTQFIVGENPSGTVTSSPSESFSIPQNDLLRPTTLTSFEEESPTRVTPIKPSKTPLEDLKSTDLWAQFTANEDLGQKVVVLPNEQYLATSFSISQNDFIQSTASMSSCVDNEIILEEMPESNMEKEQIKLDTSKHAKKSTETDTKVAPNRTKPSKSNLKRKEKPFDDDFLPKRRYSRTVLRAPLKKKSDNGKIPSQNKAAQKEPLEGKPLKATSSDEKFLLLTVEMIQKDSKPTLKDMPCTTLQNDSPVLNSGISSSLVGSINKNPTTIKEPKQSVTTEVENSTNAMLKTKESGSTSTRSLIDISDTHNSNPELTKSSADEKPVQLLTDTTGKRSDVHCNIAELVKSRKRAATNKYSNNNSSPSPAKELKCEVAKLKKLPERPSSYSSKTPVPMDLPQQEQKQRNPADLLEKPTPQHASETQSHPESDKTAATAPQPCQKSNHSIESILNKESKPYPSGNPVKDHKPSKNQGVKRNLSSAVEDGTQKKQMKPNSMETENGRLQKNPERRNGDEKFDSLVQQGNINEAILLRVTEDNKLKMERKYSPSLKPRATGKSWEPDETGTERKDNSSHGKNRDAVKIDKKMIKFDSRLKEPMPKDAECTILQNDSRSGISSPINKNPTTVKEPKQLVVTEVKNLTDSILKTRQTGTNSPIDLPDKKLDAHSNNLQLIKSLADEKSAKARAGSRSRDLERETERRSNLPYGKSRDPKARTDRNSPLIKSDGRTKESIPKNMACTTLENDSLSGICSPVNKDPTTVKLKQLVATEVKNLNDLVLKTRETGTNSPIDVPDKKLDAHSNNLQLTKSLSDEKSTRVRARSRSRELERETERRSNLPYGKSRDPKARTDRNSPLIKPDGRTKEPAPKNMACTTLQNDSLSGICSPVNKDPTTVKLKQLVATEVKNLNDLVLKTRETGTNSPIDVPDKKLDAHSNNLQLTKSLSDEKSTRVRAGSRSKELEREMERRSNLAYGKSRDPKLRTDRNSPLIKPDGRTKEQREYKQHRSSFHSEYSYTREEYHQYYSGYGRGKEKSHYPPSGEYNGRREGHHSDDPTSRGYSRRREGHHSDDTSSRGYNERRDGHHSDNPTLRQHYFEHVSGGIPRTSSLSHPTAERSSNVSGSYYKKVHKDHGEEQSPHSSSRHGSNPYTKRGAILTQEKQEALLKALQDMVHKQLNSSGVKKSSAAEDYSWLDKFNEFNGTSQFSQSSSPPSKRK